MKYLRKQLREHKGKIVWLASYPKSGNTWFRCFISALFNGKIDLSTLETDGIFSSRSVFDSVTNLDSRLLLDNEALNMIPDVYKFRAKKSERMLFMKVHDAYIYNDLGNPIFPTEISHKVIYIVRNPLDVVASFANHNASTIDEAIELMNDPNGYLAGIHEGLNTNLQFRQKMFDWSGHVNSWTKQKNVEVIIVRYEDMLSHPFETFSSIIEKIDIKASKTAIKKAISMTKFNKLQQQEKKTGFREKNARSESFFRSGKSGSYKKELTDEQIKAIVKKHKKVMVKLKHKLP